MRDYKRAAEVGFAQESQERRAKNRAHSAGVLDAHSIAYESKNQGAHLVITLADRVIDFWPGTGMFTDRKTKRNGRGVQNLVKKISELSAKAEAVVNER